MTEVLGGLSVPAYVDKDGAICVGIEFLEDVAAAVSPGAHLWHESALSLLASERPRSPPGVDSSIRAKVAVALSNSGALVADYPLRARLDQHQIEVLAALSVHGIEGLALFDEQGTGKTISCVCGFDYLARRNQADQLLVIAPKTMVGAWSATMQEWLPHRNVQLVDSAHGRMSETIGNASEMLVVTYEAAVRASSLLSAWASRRSAKTVLVIDESFFVKNAETARSKAVREIRAACALAIVSCGTPAPNSATDIVHQFDLIDRGRTFRWLERSELDKEGILEALRTRAVYLRRLKADVLPALPRRAFEVVPLALGGSQRNMYERARSLLVDEVARVDEDTFHARYSTYLARKIALLQICSHPAAVDSSYREVPAKIAYLDRVLPELIAAGEKVVVWSYFRHTLQAIVARYSSFGLVHVDGSVTDARARAVSVRAFQSDRDTRLFVGNPAAAGAGITLTAARYAIYESLSNQAAHYLQSLDRLHRRGQDRDVVYRLLMCANTVEEAEYRRLALKQQTAAQLLGDDVPRVHRVAFLHDLRGDQ